MSGSTSDNLADALGSPGISALIGAAQGFGQAAMPSRMPVPFGAALAQGLGGSLQGLKTSQEFQQGQQGLLASRMQNLTTASGLPLALSRNAMLANMWQHPEQMQQMMSGGGTATSPSAMPASDFAQRVNLSENGTGNPAALNASGPGGTPTSSAMGNGQFLSGTWLPLFKQTFPGQSADMSDAQILALRGDPATSSAMTTAYAQQNAPILQSAGIPPTSGNLALAHRYGPDGAKALIQAPPDAPIESVLGADVVSANPTLKGQTAGNVVASTTMRMGQAPVDFGASTGQPTGANALSMAQLYEQRANDLERQQNTAKWLQGQGLPVFPPSGDPAALRTAAQQFRGLALAGPTALAKSQNSNVELRQNGMAGLPNGHGGLTWIKNPGIIETQDAFGNTVPMHATPPVPGSPPGSIGEATPILGPNGQPVITKLAAQQQEGRTEAVKEFLGKDQDAYISAQNTQAWLNQIDHAADVMNSAGGIYQSGNFAPQRLALMSSINDLGRSLGVGQAFNPDAIASAEEMRKATTTAGFELASHYEGHARQAAATIMNATSAVPGMANSPQGLSLVSAGIREGAQSAIDLHEYKQNVYNHTQGAGLENAETDFAKQYPAQMYANRAISTVQPPTVAANSLAEFTAQTQKYLPGTRVVIQGQKQPDGSPVIKIVPERPGAPPIPAYIQQRYMRPPVATGVGGGG